MKLIITINLVILFSVMTLFSSHGQSKEPDSIIINNNIQRVYEFPKVNFKTGTDIQGTDKSGGVTLKFRFDRSDPDSTETEETIHRLFRFTSGSTLLFEIGIRGEQVYTKRRAHWTPCKNWDNDGCIDYASPAIGYYTRYTTERNFLQGVEKGYMDIRLVDNAMWTRFSLNFEGEEEERIYKSDLSYDGLWGSQIERELLQAGAPFNVRMNVFAKRAEAAGVKLSQIKVWVGNRDFVKGRKPTNLAADESRGAIAGTITVKNRPESDSLRSDPNESLTFQIVSDYGCHVEDGESPMYEVADIGKTWKPDFIISAGDDIGATDADIAELGCSNNPYQNIGPYLHHIRLPDDPDANKENSYYTITGNHDRDSGPYYSGVAQWKTIFQHRLDDANMENKEDWNYVYYHFTKGDNLIEFFMVDNSSPPPLHADFYNTQRLFFERAIKASTAKYQIVVMHHPEHRSIFKEGLWGDDWGILDWDFVGWGVDLVISGHVHAYERYMFQSDKSPFPLPFVTIGNGGSPGKLVIDRVPDEWIEVGRRIVDHHGSWVPIQRKKKLSDLLEPADDINLTRMAYDYSHYGTMKAVYTPENGLEIYYRNVHGESDENGMAYDYFKVIPIQKSNGNRARLQHQTIKPSPPLVEPANIPEEQPDENYYFDVYPNPVKEGAFKVEFYMEEDSKVDVKVINLSGTVVLRDQKGLQTKGFHTLPVKLPRNVAKGVYIVSLEGEKFVYKKRLAVN